MREGSREAAGSAPPPKSEIDGILAHAWYKANPLNSSEPTYATNYSCSMLWLSYKVQCVEIITIRWVMGSVSYLNHIIIPYPYLLCAFFFFAMGLAVHNWFCQIDLLDHAVKMPKLNYPQVQLQFFFGGFTSLSNQGFHEILYLDFVAFRLWLLRRNL